MRKFRFPLIKRFLKDERGQSAAVIAGVMVGVLALSAAGVETGHIYYAYRLLQASTNAAALAAGQAMPVIGTSNETCTVSGQPVSSAYCNMYLYSSSSQDSVTGVNSTNMLTNVNITASFYCSSDTSNPPINVDCTTATGCPSGGCNALTATQTANVNLWFGGLVGMSTIGLRAQASATMKGGGHPPYNIAVIIDTTGSMNDNASTSDGCSAGSGHGTPTQIQCAVYGLEQMLLEMYPCVGSGSCTMSGQYADAVGLFVFPPVNASVNNNNDYYNDYCRSSAASVNYAFPNVTAGGSQNLVLPTSGTDAGSYELIPFSSNYKTSNGATTLNTSGSPVDYLADAVGYSGTSCAGLTAPGGQGTYYAQAIYAAQAALAAQKSAETSAGYATENVLIILSDGNATACNSQANTALGGYSCSDSQIVAMNCPSVTATTNRGVTTVSCGSTTISPSGATLSCPSGGCSGSPLNGTGTSTSNPTGYQSYAYPSALGECWQAVQAAMAATSAGTKVYTVAMGSPTGGPNGGGGNCQTDKVTETTLTGGTGAESYPSSSYVGSAGSPCNAIGAMASDLTKFYSDATSGCTSPDNGQYTTIGAIFKAVGNSLSYSRLIPTGS